MLVYYPRGGGNGGGLGRKIQLIRVCVSRSEIDMVQIKEQFKTMYDQDLGKFMAVRRCLLIIWVVGGGGLGSEKQTTTL